MYNTWREAKQTIAIWDREHLPSLAGTYHPIPVCGPFLVGFTYSVRNQYSYRSSWLEAHAHCLSTSHSLILIVDCYGVISGITSSHDNVRRIKRRSWSAQISISSCIYVRSLCSECALVAAYKQLQTWLALQKGKAASRLLCDSLQVALLLCLM